jgi:hypothetical protein
MPDPDKTAAKAARKPELSVSFHNFMADTDHKSSFFARALSRSFNVKISSAGRDLQISSVFGRDPLPAVGSTQPLRVWWTSEAREPHSQLFDLYFGFRPRTLVGERWHRFPFWAACINWWDAASLTHVSRLVNPPTPRPRPRFCNFIYSNPVAIRTEFFLRLNAKRRVDSMGLVLNNVGEPVVRRAGKMRAVEESLFTIAFENQISPGYVTEKLLDPLIAGSIPIYWGAEEARSDFNPEAFIFAADFDSFDDLVAHVLKVADSKDALEALAFAPRVRENRIPYEHTPDFFADRIMEALSGKPDGRIPAEWNRPWIDARAERKKRRHLRLWRKAKAIAAGLPGLSSS